MNKWFLTFLTVLAMAGGGQAHAEPITYTETGTVLVSINGGTYSSLTVTLTGTADTTSVVGPGVLPGSADSGYYVVLTNATISAPGYAKTAFTDTIGVVDDTTIGAFEFVDGNAGNLVMLGQAQSTFSTYGLKTSIGPINTGTDSTDQTTQKYNLAGGNYVQFKGSVTNGTVNVLAVPEPSSIILVSLAGMVAFGFYRSRIAAKLS